MDNKLNRALKKLSSLVDSPFPILTVYLATEGKKSAPQSVIYSLFNSLVRQNLRKEEQTSFSADISRINEYLETVYDGNGTKSVAFFTSGKKLWEVLEFEFYLPPLCRVSQFPYFQPILTAINDHKPYLVLLADRKKARLLGVHLGKIKKHKDIPVDNVPQKVKHGDDTWDQQNKITRHIEDHLHRHLKLITDEVNVFLKDFPAQFIIIGGHKDTIPKIKKHLTHPLNKMVRGEFVTELNLPLNDIFLASKKIAEQANEKNSL